MKEQGVCCITEADIEIALPLAIVARFSTGPSYPGVWLDGYSLGRVLMGRGNGCAFGRAEAGVCRLMLYESFAREAQ